MRGDTNGSPSGYDWTAKVRKLLALAEDRATPQETRDLLMDKVTRLIVEKGLNAAALLWAQRATAPLVNDRIVVVPGPFVPEKAALLFNIARPLGCRGVLKKSPPRNQVHLFGFKSDLDRVELLFTSLLIQVGHGLASLPIPYNEDPSKYRSKYISGFTAATLTRLEQAQPTAHRKKEPSTGSQDSIELTLESRTRQVVQRMVEVYPKLADDPGSRKFLVGDGRATRDGIAAGRRADLSGGPVPNNPSHS